MESESKHKMTCDEEWVLLMVEARNIGLTTVEVRKFFDEQTAKETEQEAPKG